MSDHERDPLVRLRAADPAAGATYAHHDLAGVLSRITAVPRVERVTIARGLRLRMASALAAAALVSVAGIAALETAGPSLPVLALGASATSTHGLSDTNPSPQIATTVPRSDVMQRADITFVAGPGLSATAADAPSYTLSPAGDFATQSTQIATALGVSGSPSTTPGANDYWTIGDPSGDFVSFWSDDAELNWQYTNSSAPRPTPSPPVTTDPTTSPPTSPTTSPSAVTTTGLDDTTALADAQSLIAAVGVSGPFGAPSVSDTSDDNAGTAWTTVTLPWDVGGPGTGFQFDVTYDATGQVVEADGVAVTVAEGTSYPLLSEVAGVALLQSEDPPPVSQKIPMTTATTTTTAPGSAPTDPSTSINPGGPMIPAQTSTTDPGSTDTTGPSTTTGSSGDGSGSTGSTGTTGTTTPAPVSETVTLVSAQIEYSEYALSGGAEVLLPEYVYTGSDGSEWIVLAVDPAYVQLDPGTGGIATPLMY